MSCCGSAEEDTYGPPANQAAPPPNVNNPGIHTCILLLVAAIILFSSPMHANVAHIDPSWSRHFV
jgi:hypothetical protein